MKKFMNTLTKCRNWEIQVSNVWPDGRMSGWLEYVGVIIPSFGTCMSFAADKKNGNVVISADFPECLPEYLKKKIKSVYAKAYGEKGE